MRKEQADEIAQETAKRMKVGIIAAVEQNGGALFEYRAEIRGENLRTQEIPIFDATIRDHGGTSTAVGILEKVFKHLLRVTIEAKNEREKPRVPYTIMDVRTPTG